MSKAYKNVFRFPWDRFPDVFIHGEETSVRSHEDYDAAKTGNSEAAYRLVYKFINHKVIQKIDKAIDAGRVTLASAHAFSREYTNQ